MSKPIARVAIALLISLALIAATYITVLGALPEAGANGAQAHLVDGLQTNFNHDRSSIPELESQRLQSDVQPGNGLQKDGPCRSEAQVSPED